MPVPSTPRPERLQGYALAVLSVACALALLWALQPWLHGDMPFITMTAAVALSVWIGGSGAATVAALLGFAAVAAWQFGDGDAGSPPIARYIVASVGYFLSCAIFIAFGTAVRRSQQQLSGEAAERRLVEAALRESEDHFRHMVELNPQATWTALPDGQVDMADRWSAWTGVDGHGAGWLEAVHADDRPAAQAAWQHAQISGEPYEAEFRLRMRDGEYRWVRSRAFARRDAQGRVIKWYGSTEDVHDRRRADEELKRLNATLEEQVEARTAALRRSEARLQAVFTTSLLYQFLLRTDGTLLSANATALRGIDAAQTDVLGKPFWETPWFAQSPDIAKWARRAVRAVAAGESVQREVELLLPGGRRSFEFALRPVRDAAAAVVAIVPEALDVTGRREIEDRLRQAQKMEAVGQLTGGIAHDFNNLLQVISANLHLISRRAREQPEILQRVDTARAAVERGASMASQLLAFGRRQALEPKPLNVSNFLDGAKDMLRHAVGAGVELSIEADPTCVALVDPAQFENALLNIAVNARDAMNGSGRLDIRVGRHAAPGDAAEQVLVEIGDNGSGMAPQVLQQAFEPFFTTKPVGSGSGLGLSMVYGFVRQSGGQVKIDSLLGRGTTVRMYLPHVADAAAPLPPRRAVANAAAPQGGGETVLVVEDDAAVRESTVEMLTEMGYRVLQAADAEAALAVVESGEHLDLLFTDVVMPGPLRSTELARRARASHARLAVLFTSGYTRNVMTHGGRLDEGVELLAKPYTRDTLAHRIRAALDAGRNGAAMAPPPPSCSAQVLVVENDDAVRASTVDCLNDLGHQVVQACSAEQARSLLPTRPFDVLLVDVRLPGTSGIVFAAEARATWPEVRIIFATGDSAVADTRASGVGPIVLRKPFNRQALADALREARA